MKLIENENIVSLKKNGFTNVKNFFEEEEILNLVFHVVVLEILYKKDNYYMVSQLSFHNLKVEKI